MGEQRNQDQNPELTTIALQKFPKVFKHSKNFNPIIVEDENPSPIVLEDVHASKFFKKKTSNIVVNRKVYDVWALKMPWVEPIFNEAWLITYVKCCVCSRIEKKYKVLVAKWNSIEKHAGKRKTLDGKWFMDPKCEHAKNEIIYIQLSTTIVL
jgi:hypothetical protein